MILFKGRLSFKQYIKTKRHRFGIKVYVLCDCETGYVLGYLVYTGKNNVKNRDNDSGLGLSGDVVVKLLEPYLNKGHSFYSDNYYTSPTLANYLFQHKTNSCGTVRINRKHMPIFEKKLKKGETEWRSSEQMLVLKWRDRRDVVMLTTFHENKMITLSKVDRVTNENKTKPLCVLAYNERMGAIDRSDMMITSTDCTRKTLKWYKKLFLRTLDICMLNAHALYKTQNASNILFPAFHLEVIRQLLERYFYSFIFVNFLSYAFFRYPAQYQMKQNIQPPTVARLLGKHFPSEVPRKNGKAQMRRCWVCSHTTNGAKKRKESRFMCKDCEVGLCVAPCFQIYHEQIKY
nr:piggyBac transposable element-derived protein 4-like isoform X2 [Onthophagus taurus]XP_022902367.1 piggyBac transposable element-derived protein 4-like isoform X1 [Onthophagus taurus]XP_022907409.1 piggyBac transposable element-derived protein 4-like isoform X2 [Onthophagus taurus]XP_022914481.1 piggyBac transposable element-derived protein 4-like [Onthophagus taurus]XP_022921006.1 piggyBac transposable element-derived protein 4-like isoform X2 [Onthophagus taurus]